MEEVSNKTIATLLLVAMVISLSGTFFSLSKLNAVQGGITGFAVNPNATAQLEIGALTSIVWTVDTVDWGTGTVNSSLGQCNLTTTGLGGAANSHPGCVDFPGTDIAPLVLENDGNRNAQIDIQANATPTTWIGGTGAGFFIYVTQSELGSCSDTGGGTINYEELVALSTTPLNLCNVFEFEDANDELTLDLRVNVPTDSPPGAKIVQLTATATAV